MGDVVPGLIAFIVFWWIGVIAFGTYGTYNDWFHLSTVVDALGTRRGHFWLLASLRIFFLSTEIISICFIDFEAYWQTWSTMNYLLLTIFHLMVALGYAFWYIHESDSIYTMLAFKASWILFQIETPLAIIITFNYWGLLSGVECDNIFRDCIKPDPWFTNICVHLLNFCAVAVELHYNRLPIVYSHIIFTALWASIYWSIYIATEYNAYWMMQTDENISIIFAVITFLQTMAVLWCCSFCRDCNCSEKKCCQDGFEDSVKGESFGNDDQGEVLKLHTTGDLRSN